MLYLEANTKKWVITSDFVFMNLEKDIMPTTLIQSGATGVDQYIWEAVGLCLINLTDLFKLSLPVQKIILGINQL